MVVKSILKVGLAVTRILMSTRIKRRYCMYILLRKIVSVLLFPPFILLFRAVVLSVSVVLLLNLFINSSS